MKAESEEEQKSWKRCEKFQYMFTFTRTFTYRIHTVTNKQFKNPNIIKCIISETLNRQIKCNYQQRDL